MRAKRALLFVLLCTPLLGALVPPMPAPAEAVTTLRLEDMSTLLAPGGRLRLIVSFPGGTPNRADLAVSVYPPVGSRSEFDLVAGGSVSRAPLDVQPYDLSTLPQTGPGWLLERPVVGGPDDGPDPLRLRREGVYPVAISLRRSDGTEIDRLVTFFVFFPEPRLPPFFRVVLVAGLRAPPGLRPDGSLDPSFLSSAGRALPLITDLARSGARSGVPLTVPTNALTLDEWSTAGADGTSAVELPTSGVEYLAETYSGMPASGLAERRLDAETTTQLERGRAELVARGVEPTNSLAVAPPGPIGTRSLRRLAQAGVSQVLVDEGSLSPLDLDLTLTRPFLLDLGTLVMEAATPDPLLSSLAGRPTEQPRAVAARLFAELTVLYLDAPGETRGAVVELASGAVPDHDVWSFLMDDLRQAPYLLPVTLSRFFADVPHARDGADAQKRLTRTLRTSEASLPDALVSRMIEARGQTESLRQMTGDTPTTQLAGELVTVALGAVTDATPWLSAAERLVRQQIGTVEAVSDSVTLAAARGDLPVTVDNHGNDPLTVTISFATDRLRFPDGHSRQVVLTPRRQSVSVPIEALTTGSFPLDVVITSPCSSVDDCSSALVVARTRITVTSTRVSRVAVVVAGGALVFLLVWWGREMLTRPRRRAHSRRRLGPEMPAAEGEMP